MLSLYNPLIPKDSIVITILLHTWWWKYPFLWDNFLLLECSTTKVTVIGVNENFSDDHTINKLNLLIDIGNNLKDAKQTKPDIVTPNYSFSTSTAQVVTTATKIWHTEEGIFLTPVQST